LVVAALVVLGLLVTGCVARTNSPRSSEPGGAGGSNQPPGAEAKIRPVSERQWQRMSRAGMVRPECPIASRKELRVVAVNHIDFEGNVRRGRLVVNADVADSVAGIFTELYERRFPIRRMVPVERYDGDTNRSLRADNTSAFNCRRADQINAPFADSPHANGRAVDINPRENPWKDLRCNCWVPSARFKERKEGPGVILRGGLVWRVFRQEGWIWQNIPVADYMHFDTGYPSRDFPELAGNS
jgi:hypothetical protein